MRMTIPVAAVFVLSILGIVYIVGASGRDDGQQEPVLEAPLGQAPRSSDRERVRVAVGGDEKTIAASSVEDDATQPSRRAEGGAVARSVDEERPLLPASAVQFTARGPYSRTISSPRSLA